MTTEQILVIALAFTVAGIAKGAIGIGMPPIAIGLMTLRVPLADALALLTFPTLLTNVNQAFTGGHFRPLARRFRSMAVMAVIGVLGAGFFLGKLGSPSMIAWLGVVLTIYAAIALFAWRPVMPIAHEGWANPLIGLASGVVAGVTGMAAVPFLPYMQSLQMTRNDLVQGLGILFLVIMLALAVALVQQNIFTSENAVGSVLALAPTFLGVTIGNRIRHAASPETFRKIFLAGMLLLGLNMASGLL
ncbi:MAG: sulfite exporter TauE/SafE family protein [Alphaproteobacteria bacterium]|nr:sulfite exporter TauE/SafE family protein [Alphaproteobacteria bacterium]